MKKVISNYSGIIFKTFSDVLNHFITSDSKKTKNHSQILDKKNYKVLKHWKGSEQNICILKMLLGKKIFYCYIDPRVCLISESSYYIIYELLLDVKYKHDIIFIVPVSDFYKLHHYTDVYIACICVCKNKSNGLYWICILQCNIKNSHITIIGERMKLSKLFDVEPKSILIRKDYSKHIEVDISNYGKVIYTNGIYRYTQHERNREDRFEYIFAKM